MPESGVPRIEHVEIFNRPEIVFVTGDQYGPRLQCRRSNNCIGNFDADRSAYLNGLIDHRGSNGHFVQKVFHGSVPFRPDFALPVSGISLEL